MTFANLVADKTNFTPGKNTKLFVSSAYFQNEARPEKTDDLAVGAVTSGATTITVANGFDVDLYEGTILCYKTDWTNVAFGDDYFTNYFVVSDFVAANTTTIPVFGTTETAAGGETIRIPAWIPYFSSASADFGRTSTIITGNVFSDGLAQQKAQIGLDNTVSISGNEVWNDPGLPVLREAVNAGKVFNLTRVRPLLRGLDSAIGFVSDFSDTAPDQEFMTQTGNVAVTGQTYYGSARTAA